MTVATNIVKEVFKDAAEAVGLHFEYGTPEEINDRMAKLGAVNKDRFPVLMLFDGYTEAINRYWLTVDGLQFMIADTRNKQLSEKTDDKFNALSVYLNSVMVQLSRDNRIAGTAPERFTYTRVRRTYDNVGGVPAVAWLVTFTENNNFKNICTNDRF